MYTVPTTHATLTRADKILVVSAFILSGVAQICVFLLLAFATSPINKIYAAIMVMVLTMVPSITYPSSRSSTKRVFIRRVTMHILTLVAASPYVYSSIANLDPDKGKFFVVPLLVIGCFSAFVSIMFVTRYKAGVDHAE